MVWWCTYVLALSLYEGVATERLCPDTCLEIEKSIHVLQVYITLGICRIVHSIVFFVVMFCKLP